MTDDELERMLKKELWPVLGSIAFAGNTKINH
jgi:hypothetical protein